jgi:hypothetical protein
LQDRLYRPLIGHCYEYRPPDGKTMTPTSAIELPAGKRMIEVLAINPEDRHITVTLKPLPWIPRRIGVDRDGSCWMGGPVDTFRVRVDNRGHPSDLVCSQVLPLVNPDARWGIWATKVIVDVFATITSWAMG